MCADVEAPPNPLALPTQSTLLRGVVQIEFRKAVYLLEDAVESQSALRLSDRLLTTASASKIKARSEAITIEAGQLPQEDFLQYGNVEDLLLFQEASQDRELVDLSLQADRYRAREAAFTARPEDITLSQVGMEARDIAEFDLSLGAFTREMDITGEELAAGELGMDMEGLGVEPVSPTTAVSAAAAAPSPPAASAAAEEAEAAALAERVVQAVKRRRGKKAIKLQIDEQTELPDTVIRSWLQDTSDIVTVRSTLALHLVGSAPLVQAIAAPRALPMHRSRALPELLSVFKLQQQPVLAAPAEEPSVEAAMAAEAGWEPTELALEGEALAAAEEVTIPPYELEMERDVSTESIFSARSFLGKPLDDDALEEERRLNRASAGLEDSFRRRRDSRISVSGSFQTPEIDIPVSQFEIPRVEAVRMSLDASLSERRSISKLTELFLAEVQARIQENTQRGEIPEVEFDELLEDVVGARPTRRDRSVSFFQLLVLTSLDIVKARQPAPHGPIVIQKGAKWDSRLSASQSM